MVSECALMVSHFFLSFLIVFILFLLVLYGFSRFCIGFNSFLMIYQCYLVPKSFNSPNHIINSKLYTFPIKTVSIILKFHSKLKPQLSHVPEPEVPGLVGQSSEATRLYTRQLGKESWTAATFFTRKEAILMPRPILAVGSGGGKGELSGDSEVL